MPEALYLSELQAADLLEVRLSTLQRWRRERKGPRWAKLGRRVVYLPEALRDWLAAGGNQ